MFLNLPLHHLSPAICKKQWLFHLLKTNLIWYFEAQTDKVEDIRKEKERRLRGQTLGETQEERDRLARKRENEKIKKEKDVST